MAQFFTDLITFFFMIMAGVALIAYLPRILGKLANMIGERPDKQVDLAKLHTDNKEREKNKKVTSESRYRLDNYYG